MGSYWLLWFSSSSPWCVCSGAPYNQSRNLIDHGPGVNKFSYLQDVIIIQIPLVVATSSLSSGKEAKRLLVADPWNRIPLLPWISCPLFCRSYVTTTNTGSSLFTRKVGWRSSAHLRQWSANNMQLLVPSFLRMDTDEEIHEFSPCECDSPLVQTWRTESETPVLLSHHWIAFRGLSLAFFVTNNNKKWYSFHCVLITWIKRLLSFVGVCLTMVRGDNCHFLLDSAGNQRYYGIPVTRWEWDIDLLSSRWRGVGHSLENKRN